jgi:outer membrane protein
MRREWSIGRIAAAALASVALAAIGPTGAQAETLSSALAKAYRNNPQLNAQRAVVRQIDETVPQALSGYRPQISATADVGVQYQDARTSSALGGSGRQQSTTYPRGVGLTATQTLFNGLRTGNQVRSAESNVRAARETLRVFEQQVLFDAATSYMNMLRDTALVQLQRSNVEVLTEQLRQTRDRFNVGEVTRTDVAQAESRLAAARSALLAAEATLNTSRATYRRVIGEDPVNLAPGSPVDRLSPRSLDVAVAKGQAQNPNVTAAMYGVDVATLQVKIAEGALYPVVTLQGNLQQNWETSAQTSRSFAASAVVGVTFPLYQGGAEYATIRQQKELLGQRRLDLDAVRDQARATVVEAWGQLLAARSQIESAQAQVNAAEIALNGVREEARVGQRTTLDVLNQQQELVNARVALVTAQRDRVVASYALLAAIGNLNPQVLGLPTPVYDPQTHYHQVRDAWSGVRTPDGR